MPRMEVTKDGRINRERDAGRESRNRVDNSAGASGGVPESDGDTPLQISYLRDPRLRFFSFVCRCLVFLRCGLLMMKVPLPTYSAL